MKTINKIGAAAFFGISSLVLGAPALQADHGKNYNVEEHVQDMKEKLNLTSTQEGEIRKILEEKKQKKEALRNEAHEKIRSVLTEDQKNEFNEMVREKEGH